MQISAEKRKRRMCNGLLSIFPFPNELVFELCREIQVLQTPNKILLTSINIHTYLVERHSKKQFYREAIFFIKTTLNNGQKVTIHINQFVWANQGQDQDTMLHRYHDNGDLELRIGRLRILIVQSRGDLDNVCRISNDAFENVHAQYFVHLIAPLIQPFALNLLKLRYTTILGKRNALSGRIGWVLVRAEHFMLEPICTALNKCCTKLTIHFHPGLTSAQMKQFRRTFIQWLQPKNQNTNGQPKLCSFICLTDLEQNLLLEEIKTDFLNATRKRSFAVRFCASRPMVSEPFRVHNNIGELLEFRRKFHFNCFTYTLIRRPITESDNNMGLYSEAISVLKMAESERTLLGPSAYL